MADSTSDEDMSDTPVAPQRSRRAGSSTKKPTASKKPAATKKSAAIKKPRASKKTPAPKRQAPKNSKVVESSEDESSSDEDYDELDTQPRNGLDLNLPPISDVGAAFKDLVRNACRLTDPGGVTLRDVANAGGFVMRVATMCSGTEAPIFALRLIQEAFCAQEKNELFRLKHIFTVEIEPYKQAYIRRNTDAVVFRDVRDFTHGDGEEFTA